MDQCTNVNDDSLVSVASASKMPAPPYRSTMPLPSPLRTRSASIRPETVSKPSSGSLRPVTDSHFPARNTCLQVSDDADVITKRSDTFVPNGGENHRSSKDEPLSSVPTSSPDMKAPPPPNTFNHPSRLYLIPQNRSDSGRNIPLVSANGDSSNVPPEKSSASRWNFVLPHKATTQFMERKNIQANPMEGVLENATDNDNLPSVSPPTLHATFDVTPGSPMAQRPTSPASGMDTSPTTEQASRE
ncbi:hypothetical protein EDC04DRAFT_2688465, partial [Pisolithus marmoratus]